MEKIYHTGGIIDIMSAGCGLIQMAGAGIRDILLDFSMFYDRKMKTRLTNVDYYIQTFFDKSKANGLTVRMAYLPDDSVISDRDELYDVTLKCLEICAHNAIKKVVFFPLQEEVFVNKQYFKSIINVCKQYDMEIYISNKCKEFNGHYVRYDFSNSSIIRTFFDEIIEETNFHKIKVCVDVGACNLCGQNMREFFNVLGERIQAVIVRENDGNSNCSMLPFSCAVAGYSKLDWLSFFRGIRDINFNGDLIFDFRHSMSAVATLLKPSLLAYAKQLEDYFLMQINMEKTIQKYSSRVLFGAGNMCRNYMKCYGDEFTPLFTCDNNPKMWDTEFEGLKVRNPEALKSIPKDCAIFICNIYYAEIKKQLLEMEIDNPIEIFNDEYMPSFYLDRIDVSKR